MQKLNAVSVLALSFLCGVILFDCRASDSPRAIIPPAHGYLYALNDDVAGNKIAGYIANASGGSLFTIPGFPVATGGNGSGKNASEQLAVDHRNARLYAINAGSNTVSAYSIDLNTGALTALPFSPINLGTGNWYTIAVHPSGSPLIVGDADGNLVESFVITATAATAAAGSPFTTATASPFSSVFSRKGDFFYTSGNNNGNNFLAGFQVNSTTGALTALSGSPFNTIDSYSVALQTDATGRLLSTTFSGANLRAYTTSAGIPAAVTGDPFASGLSKPTHGALHPNGFYMVADRANNQVGVYQIAGSGAGTTLAPVTGSPFASGGTFTDALALNHDGTILFAANATTLNITGFTVAPLTGVLSSPVTQSANAVGASGRIGGLGFIAPPVDLTLTVVSTPTTVVAGSGAGNLVYTLTLKNNGPSDASGVAVTNIQSLPSGVSYDSASPSAGSFDNTNGLWTVGNLANGATVTLAITNTVSATAPAGTANISDSATAGANETLINTSDDSATATTSVSSTIVSGPTATPSTAGVGQPVNFSIVVTGSGLTYAWNFGDGGTDSGASVNHAYAAVGTYTASVTITSPGNPTQTASVQVTVVAPLVGSGNDSDGDGFSDALETIAGTDPHSAASTPIGQPLTAALIQSLTISKASIKLNFMTGGKDSISFSGTLLILADFAPNGQKVFVDVGGNDVGFVLNAKGQSKSGNDSLKISIKSKKGSVAAQTAKYSVKLSKGSFSGALADEGLTGTADLKNVSKTVVFSLIFNNTVLQKSQTLSYTAKKNKSGSAK
ncbi:MAG TPA: PKD domain-containing protein [Planctomycetota bacterium]|nr:PKD domain-containing protein [Planctomycetota bacterium]